MKIVNLSEQNSIINQYMAEMRDVDYQKNRFLFRNNIQRIGEFEAFEISKTLDYEPTKVTTPLGEATVNLPTDKVVLATIFRAGLPFHNGFLNVFDHAGNAFVSAYREYTDAEHHNVGIHVEYLATPDIDGKTLIIADPMLATGGSAILAVDSLKKRGASNIKFVCLVAAPEGVKALQAAHPDVEIFTAALDEHLNEHGYIVPGLGDAGDRLFGTK